MYGDALNALHKTINRQKLHNAAGDSNKYHIVNYIKSIIGYKQEMSEIKTNVLLTCSPADQNIQQCPGLAFLTLGQFPPHNPQQ